MINRKIIQTFIICLGLIFSINTIWANENVSLELLSNKQIYQVGENINLTLKIENLNEEVTLGEIKGKVIIGDIGYEIQCFDYKAPAKNSQYLGLNSLPASLSNSNSKTMSTLYACGGTQMQSTETIVENNPISQNGQEVFEINPFTYSYEYNGEIYETKSNSLSITIESSQNQQQQQQEEENQNQNENEQNQEQSQNQQDQAQQNQQSPNNEQTQQNSQTQNGKTLSQQGQQALANNQQNAQSVNQLKQDIADAKANPLNTDIQTEEKKFFWLLFFILLTLILVSVFVYFKYFKKEETKEEIKIKPEIPKYIKLLNKVKSLDDEKEKAKVLSQAIKTYIAQKNSLDVDLTHSKAIKLTNNKKFIEILNKTESIEFAGKKIKLDYNKLVKEVRGEFK